MVRFYVAVANRVRSVRGWSLWILRVIGLGLAYYITGRLALSLAIPPGFATAVWPPAGLSLAALLHFGTSLWPGIWLGQFLINVGDSYDPFTHGRVVAFGAVAATGAVLQALVGTKVVRRYVGFPNPLIQVRDIAGFMMLGGPATCLISSTIGVSALWWIGRISGSEFLFNWFTWWVGDAIGVIALTTLLLVWTPTAGRQTRYRRWVVTVPVLGAAMLVLILFVFASRREQARFSQELRQDAATAAATLEHRLAYSLEALFALRTLSRQSDGFDKEKFETVAADFLARRPAIQTVSWNPRVRPRGDPADPAAASNSSYPAAWIVPAAGNESPAGFDVMSDPNGHAAVERACTSGETTASGPVSLGPHKSLQGMLIVLPVAVAASAPVSVPVPVRVAGDVPVAGPVTSCHERLLGVFVAVYRLDRLLEIALGPTAFDSFRYRLVDDANGSSLLYDSADGTNGANGANGHDAAVAADATAIAEPTSSAKLRLVDRPATLYLVPTAAFVNSQRSLQAWSILAGGLLFTSALACILLVVTGRTLLVQRMGEERTTAALLLSESKDRALFEQTTAGIVELYPSLELLRANQRFCDMVGRSFDELRTLNLADITHPDDHEADRLHFQQALNKALPPSGWTKRYVRPDGSIVWVRVSGSVVRDSRDQPAYLIGVVQDITDLVKVERALARSQSQLMAFVEHAPAAVAMLDRDLRYVAVSRRWLEDYKLGDRDLRGLHHYDVFPEIRQMPEWLAAHQRVLAGSVERSEEDHFVRADGRDEWLQWEVRPWYDDDGTIGGIIMLSEIITARKQAAQELQRSEARLRLTIDSANLGLWEWDLTTSQVTVDENWAHIMGYDAADSLAEVAKVWRESIHPDDWTRLTTLLERYTHGGSDESFDIDYRAMRKDGRKIWLNSRGRFDRRDAEGHPLHMIGTIQDVTDRKSAEELIRASLQEKEVLLREIHHRVKNNLAVVASLFYLQSTTSEQPEVIQLFEESRNRIRSMALVHEQLYRSDQLSAVDFAEYATELSRQLLRSYGRPNGAIRLTTSLTPVRMSVNVAIPCGLVLNELLTNCLKHAFNGLEPGEIEIGLVRVSGATYELRVSDDGVGTAGADVSGTHSLGLRLARSLAGQLNGTLAIEPRVRGTCARLTFTL